VAVNTVLKHFSIDPYDAFEDLKEILTFHNWWSLAENERLPAELISESVAQTAKDSRKFEELLRMVSQHPEKFSEELHARLRADVVHELKSNTTTKEIVTLFAYLCNEQWTGTDWLWVDISEAKRFLSKLLDVLSDPATASLGLQLTKKLHETYKTSRQVWHEFVDEANVRDIPSRRGHPKQEPAAWNTHMRSWAAKLNVQNATHHDVDLFVEVWKTMFIIARHSAFLNEQLENYLFQIVATTVKDEKINRRLACKMFAAYVDLADAEALCQQDRRNVANRILDTRLGTKSDETDRKTLKFVLACKDRRFRYFFHCLSADDFLHYVARSPVTTAFHAMNCFFNKPILPSQTYVNIKQTQ
jgi:hypothetical protein